MLLPENATHHIHHGDTIPHMHAMPAASVDLMVTSVPFPSVFAYTDSSADLGNSEDLRAEGRIHFSFFFRAMLRVMKPGRVMVIHCQQIAKLKRSGGRGLNDFRGLLIRLGQRAGFDYEYDWLIRKNPQAEAIRTKKWEIKFEGLESDRARSRGALADYLVKFTAPGDNAVPIDDPGQVSRNDWIQWAESRWDDIRQTRTLNYQHVRRPNDTRHICPLQLDTVNRLIRLYSDPGEIVFDPFAGIGTVPYEALKLGRRAYGCELKDEYHAEAIRNCERAIAQRRESETAILPGFAVGGERSQRSHVAAAV